MDTNPKFYVSNKIGFDNWPDFGDGNTIKNTDDNKIAVVYQTWGTEGYVPYIYHSIISQVMYTDILDKANIYIFVDDHEERYKYICWLFRNIINKSNIIKTPIKPVKYMVTCHPILSKYEIISVVDADMFFWSTEKIKHGFYKSLEDHYKVNNNTMLMLAGTNNMPVSNVFWERKEVLCGPIGNDEYISMVLDGSGMSNKQFENWLLNDRWNMSGIFIYDKSVFDNTQYYKYALMNCYNSQLCDETVWSTWAVANDIKMINISDVTGFNYLLYLDNDLNHYMENNKSLYLLHPIVGDTLVNDFAVDLLNNIREEFKIFLNNI